VSLSKKTEYDSSLQFQTGARRVCHARECSAPALRQPCRMEECKVVALPPLHLVVINRGEICCCVQWLPFGAALSWRPKSESLSAT